MHNRNTILGLSTVILLLTLISVDPVFAAPGGRIAEAMFESFWGKLFMLLLVIIFSPLIAYVYLREWLTVRKTSKDLRFMAQHAPYFEVMRIKERATDCVHRVHSAWSKEDVGEASKWMTNWYWQKSAVGPHQQMGARRPRERM